MMKVSLKYNLYNMHMHTGNLSQTVGYTKCPKNVAPNSAKQQVLD